ncbi:MAG: hypothetical protein KKB47_10980 [Alphaproteobacteria bacterium]|nr:hypothetical protein [Alphaproteobacteria bacterium]MBU2095368.1 hypothetical protein [Alphaproteobacteria bacterium]MBU2306670.1 hypothetical protein [Alphaproteobacteria bacterium]MBU2363374.1 hypothetical protein [Alphaproteobacteria bacterium]
MSHEVNLLTEPNRDASHPPARNKLAAKVGSHSAYARGPDLIVEWYDFGDDTHYESANFLVFKSPAQQMLAQAIGGAAGFEVALLAAKVAAHFDSYFEVKAFAAEHSIPFATDVEFQP